MTGHISVIKFPSVFTMILILFTGLVSCSSDKIKSANDHSSIDVSQVAKITYYEDPASVKSFTYDSVGNLTMFVQGGDTTDYVYSENMLLKKYRNPVVHIDAGTQYKLDADGKIISGEVIAPDKSILVKLDYKYDSNGYLIQSTREMVIYARKTTKEFEYKDGNLITMKEKDANGKLISTYGCEYYTDKTMNQNVFVQTFIEDIVTKDRLGKMNKNFIKNSYNISTAGDTLSHMNYTYENINDPKSMKMMEHDVNNDFKMPITYWYK